MKKFFTLLAILLYCFIGCTKDENPVTRTDSLRERFNGQYKITRAVSNEALDINMDGVPSSNLLTEIMNLDKAYLVLQVKDEINIYSQFWPEQYLSYEANKDTPLIMYALQSFPFTFTFNSVKNEFELVPVTPLSEAAIERYVIPKAVSVQNNGEIHVSFSKKIYSMSGFQEIDVLLVYERWTPIT